MKNKIKFSAISAFLFSLLFFGQTHAQPWLPATADESQTIFRTGQVAIGHPVGTAISDQLDINGSIRTNNDLNVHGNIKGQALGGANFNIFAGTSNADGAYIRFPGEGANDGIEINTGGLLGDFKVTSPYGTIFKVNPYGKTIIGPGVDDSPDTYRLAVGGGIVSEQVLVCPDETNWCDYVFEEDYDLNSIEFVEKHIKENKHLPNVPSAKEVGEEGINLGEMDAVLLRQIEELWLHVIEMKKENAAMQEELNKFREAANSK